MQFSVFVDSNYDINCQKKGHLFNIVFFSGYQSIVIFTLYTGL